MQSGTSFFYSNYIIDSISYIKVVSRSSLKVKILFVWLVTVAISSCS